MNSAPATKAGRYGHCPAVPKLCQNYVTNTRSHDRSLIKSDTHLPKKQVASTFFTVPELCQNPSDWGLWRSVLSERQTPQVIVFSRKRLEKGERIDRAFVRPRQVRYQAALRPDILARRLLHYSRRFSAIMLVPNVLRRKTKMQCQSRQSENAPHTTPSFTFS
jgi:hypothetical protein